MKLFWISFLLFTSCSVFDNEQIIENELQGEWKWVQSTGGFIGETIHSDSVDYEMKLVVFNEESAFWYRDGKILQKYVIGERSEGEEDKLLLNPMGDSHQRPLIVSGIYEGQLHLYENCMDCYSHIFRK